MSVCLEGAPVQKVTQKGRRFGQYLRKRMVELGGLRGRRITQREVANAIGISEKHFSELVRGLTGVERETLERFILPLGLHTQEEIDELYHVAGFAAPGEEIVTPAAPSRIIYFSEDGQARELPEGKFANAREITGDEKRLLLEAELSEIKSTLAEILRRLH